MIGMNSIYEEELLSMQTKSLLESYQQCEQESYMESSNQTYSEETRNKSILDMLFEFVSQVIKLLTTSLRDIYLDIKEVLPELFDKIIEGLLLYLKDTKQELEITFEQIYKIFQIFGLDEILSSTFDKINASYQWKICSLDFISIDFLHDYKSSLLSGKNEFILNSISDLEKTLTIFEKERKDARDFEKEIAMILE